MKVYPLSAGRGAGPGACRSEVFRLPVSPRANHRIRYEKYVSRMPHILPDDAVLWLDQTAGEDREACSIQVEGPGDPFSTPDVLFDLLQRLTGTYGNAHIGITTLGLGLEPHIGRLKANGISQVTLLVNGVFPTIAEKVYAWIRPGTRTMALPDAVKLLVREQEQACIGLSEAGIRVHVRTVIYPEINDDHVGDIAEKMAGCGAVGMTLVPYPGAAVGDDELLSPCDRQTAGTLEHAVSQYLAVVPAERVVSPLDEDGPTAMSLPAPTSDRPNVAVATSNGMDIDLHLGQAGRLLVYGPREDGLACLLEARRIPRDLNGEERWQALAENCLADCFALLVAAAGERPRKVLSGHGIRVLQVEDVVEGTVDALFGQGKKMNNCAKN